MKERKERKDGRKGGRKEERKEGRTEGRGRKEGREEGRKGVKENEYLQQVKSGRRILNFRECFRNNTELNLKSKDLGLRYIK